MAGTNTIKSELQTFKEIAESDIQFNIPRYQRLYVWVDEQIDTLLEDLLDAFVSKKKLYYMGGILIVKSDSKANLFDLIDGQQRFTTLWLLSFELKHSLEKFLRVDDELRLRFSIRKKASEYFQKLLKNDPHGYTELPDDDKENSLSKIANSQGRIQRFISEELIKNNIRPEDFAAYIFENVCLIITEVPPQTDLNKLFEVTNNRGVQLKQHEILKAKILKPFSNKQKRIRYGKIWDACSEMENYIERNLASETGLKNNEISECFDKNNLVFDLDKLFRKLIDRGKSQQEIKPIRLDSILSDKSTSKFESINNKKLNEHPEEEEGEEEPVRSILSFPQLLLHTLRIYLLQNGANDIHKISEKELLHTFNEYAEIDNEIKAKKFIRLLFDVRFVFDLFIIKWIKISDNEEIHGIKPLQKYNKPRKWIYYLRRNKVSDNDGFTLLQAMLYHSQQITTQYWLTPILWNALHNKHKSSLYDKLRLYDNILFCTNDDRTLPERTWSLLKMISAGETLKGDYNTKKLHENLGVDFPHYWFYKLEFILWYRLRNVHTDWKNFRMTAKNSVEHVSPQNPNYKEDIVSDLCLNSLGNLALVSRKINSEFSNKPFKEKKARFLYSRKGRVDSLKLDLIYRNDRWDDDLCEEHKKDIIRHIEGYLNEFR